MRVIEDLFKVVCGQSIAKGFFFLKSESENEADGEVDGWSSEFFSKDRAASEEDSTDEPAGNHHESSSRNLIPLKRGDKENSVDLRKMHKLPDFLVQKVSKSDRARTIGEKISVVQTSKKDLQKEDVIEKRPNICY